MTVPESPAALLRRAADRVQEVADMTAPEPWLLPSVRALLVPWVGLMSPQVAAPLAAWFREEADEAEQVGADRHAVAFARILVGEDQP